MDKDEMKNKISMAIKDPTLQQGFEIICKELEAEKKLNAEIKARFVKCNTCTDEMKSKCLMFSESLCQGERCEELVDLMGLISKSELEKENTELKEELTKKADTNHSLVEQMADLESENAELIGKVAFLENDLNNAKAQIEKLIDFVLSKIECCDVCPITDTCINSEGTCPYVGILAKGEEEVTREWLMQFISRR